MLEPNFENTCQNSRMLLMFLEVGAVAVWFYMFFQNKRVFTCFYDILDPSWKHVGAILEHLFDKSYVQRVCLWTF